MIPRGLIGVIHLLPLPGDPHHDGGGLDAVIDRALADATALADGGAAGAIVENFGSAPFQKGTGSARLPGYAVAAMTRVVLAVRERVSLPLGVNCLRNDASSALGIAAATGAGFIRVNVHTGAYVTDQGVIEGEAHATLRERAALDSSVSIAADVLVKHARPLAPIPIGEAARDAVERGLADAVIVTGAATGEPVKAGDVTAVRQAVGDDVMVIVGSGVTADRAAEVLGESDAAIVGTALKVDGDVRGPVDPERVRSLWAACRGAFR